MSIQPPNLRLEVSWTSFSAVRFRQYIQNNYPDDQSYTTIKEIARPRLVYYYICYSLKGAGYD
jgi:hypothetical protein